MTIHYPKYVNCPYCERAIPIIDEADKFMYFLYKKKMSVFVCERCEHRIEEERDLLLNDHRI